MHFKPYVFVLNPKCTANYKKSYIGLGKSDPIDAFVIADYARAGNIETEPWRGSQFLALKRLTRHGLLARNQLYSGVSLDTSNE